MSDTPRLSRKRAIAVWSLVVLATLLLLISSLTVWVKRQALDTDAWTKASGQLLADDEVRGALSIYLVNTLYSNVDVTARVKKALPPERSGLAPVISGALREFSERAANQLLASPRAQALWEQVNRRAHKNLIAVLNGDDVRRFSTADGTVVFDVSPLVKRLGDRLGISAKLPPDAGKITILKADQLSAAQNGFKAIKALTVFLVLVVLGLYALAIYLAHGHRRRIFLATAVSFVLVGLLVLLVRRLTGDWIVDSLVKTDTVKPAGRTVWSIAGPSGWAVSVRRRLAPTFRDHPGETFTGVAFLYLLFILWSPTAATRQIAGILVLGALLVLGVLLLRRQTLAEFPAERAPG